MRQARSARRSQMCRQIQKRGMKFAGTVIIYSHLQAVGRIGVAHEDGCFLEYKM